MDNKEVTQNQLLEEILEKLDNIEKAIVGLPKIILACHGWLEALTKEG